MIIVTQCLGARQFKYRFGTYNKVIKMDVVRGKVGYTNASHLKTCGSLLRTPIIHRTSWLSSPKEIYNCLLLSKFKVKRWLIKFKRSSFFISGYKGDYAVPISRYNGG